jgi:hypothetical protein
VFDPLPPLTGEGTVWDPSAWDQESLEQLPTAKRQTQRSTFSALIAGDRTSERLAETD